MGVNSLEPQTHRNQSLEPSEVIWLLLLEGIIIIINSSPLCYIYHVWINDVMSWHLLH